MRPSDRSPRPAVPAGAPGPCVPRRDHSDRHARRRGDHRRARSMAALRLPAVIYLSRWARACGGTRSSPPGRRRRARSRSSRSWRARRRRARPGRPGRRTRACRSRRCTSSTARSRRRARPTAASSSAAGTTRLTRPQSSAVAASIVSPVSSICIARLRPTARETGTIGVEQNSPILTPGVPNRAPSAATARSHAATSWQPAAVAIPCTFAITGCGRS